MDVKRRSGIVARTAAVFVGTWLLFYFTALDDQSPIYTDSDQRGLLLFGAWIGVGFVLLAARQRTWGIAWLLGSTGGLAGCVAILLGLAFALGS